MGELMTTGGRDLMSLLHGSSGGLELQAPFQRDIFLFDTYVAGTSHVTGMEELAPHLQVDDRLHFFREPDNLYDAKAIVIKNEHGVKIGYVPQADNVIFSRLMDAGKLLFGRITDKDWKGKWLKLKIGIYLQD